jgi:dTDP-4-dehydrorhamnose reductase
MKVLILGASGMLGNAVLRVLSEAADLDVWGTARSGSVLKFFGNDVAKKILTGIDVENIDAINDVMVEVRPDVVINCVGVVKQLAQADDPLKVLPINAMLPHRLAKVAAVAGARVIHISTDCVFSGDKGNYLESDVSDATDLYGKSKHIGELQYPHTVTLRTSIIGHELQHPHSLIDWFLSQQGTCRGFTNAIFSGLPTVVLAMVIRDVVLRQSALHGLYHVSAPPISKYDLLRLVAEVYGKNIDIQPDASLVIDRSLDSSRFKEATGYATPSWEEMIKLMNLYK